MPGPVVLVLEAQSQLILEVVFKVMRVSEKVVRLPPIKEKVLQIEVPVQAVQTVSLLKVEIKVVERKQR